MRLSQYIDQQPTRRKKAKASARRSVKALPTHRAFVPMVSVWGASLLGLSVAVLPTDLVTRMSVLTSTGFLGTLAMPAYAATAALLGGGIGFILSAALRERAVKDADSAMFATAVASRRDRLIDPALDLGSQSLDSPIEEVPFAATQESDEPRQPTLGELSQRGYEIEAPEDCSAAADEDDAAFTRKHFANALIETCEAHGCEADGAEDDAASPSLPEAPRALDLSEFADLPGRNAVWVEEPVVEAPKSEAEPEDVKAAPEPAPEREAAPVPATALEKLRARRPEDLSLVEMVERFAGALHEHQEAESTRHQPKAPGRDAALAEALKALTLFNQHGFDQPAPGNVPGERATEIGETERELRTALARLQTLSGAA